jgi:signal peptidase
MMTAARRFTGSAAANSGSVAGARGRWGPLWWSSAVLGLAVAWLALAGSLTFWATAPSLMGWHPYVVLTNSMRPGLAPGDVVLISHDAGPTQRPLHPGEIALIADADRKTGSRLHRFVRSEDDGRVVTKGDANYDEDSPSPASAVLGRTRLVVPSVGLPLIWLRHADYLPLGLVVVGTWMAFLVVLRRRNAVEGPETLHDGDRDASKSGHQVQPRVSR